MPSGVTLVFRRSRLSVHGIVPRAAGVRDAAYDSGLPRAESSAGRGVPSTPGAGGGVVLQEARLAMRASSAELLRITSHKAKVTPGNGVGGIEFKSTFQLGLCFGVFPELL